MKFCFILTQDLNSPAGFGRYFPLANGLNKLGHSVEIIALHSDFKNLLHKRVRFTNNFNVNYVAQMHVLKINNDKQYFSFLHLIWIVLLATIKLSEFSFKANGDVYIIGKPHPMNSIAGMVCKIIRKPLLIVDCDDDETNSGNFKYNWQKKIIRLFEKFIPTFVDFVTTNTQYSESRLISDGVKTKNIYYLPNGVDKNRFSNIEKKKLEMIKFTLDITDSSLIIGYIGSMSLANHAIILLIDAYEIVLNTMKNIILLMVGGGEDFDYIKSYVIKKGLKEKVIFVGKISPDEVKYYYKISNITVDPVYNDIAAKARLPMKMFESWIVRVPFVTSDVGDRKKFLTNPPSGLIAKEDNPTALANEIIRILSDRNLAKKISENGFEKSKNFHWEIISRDFNNYLVKRISQ